jgi:hypothetical protein
LSAFCDSPSNDCNVTESRAARACLCVSLFITRGIGGIKTLRWYVRVTESILRTLQCQSSVELDTAVILSL